MLTIRLQRAGKRNHSHFRVVLAEKTAHVSKKIQETLGSYNPHTKEFVVKDPVKLQYWLDQNVELSPTVHNLLVIKGILKADKVRAFNTPKIEKPAEVAPAAPAAAATTETPAAPAEESAPVKESAPEAPAVVAEPVAEAPVAASTEAPIEAPVETPAA
jgi:small subunit ribosomal protein S16